MKSFGWCNFAAIGDAWNAAGYGASVEEKSRNWLAIVSETGW